MSEYEDWNKQIIEEFRANDGKVGGMFESMPLVLLHSIGAKSGQPRIHPLAAQDIGAGRLAVFASKGGAPSHPDWYYNLLANPDASIEYGMDTISVKARVAEGDERERIWTTQKERHANFAEYEQMTTRQIPVVVLEPVA